jgi:hypothetical protein
MLFQEMLIVARKTTIEVDLSSFKYQAQYAEISIAKNGFLEFVQKTKTHAWEWLRLVQSILNIEATIALIEE